MKNDSATPLDNIRDEQESAASQMDELGDKTMAALAAQLKAINPEASGMVLSALAPVLALMGGKIEGGPTTLADLAVARALSAVSDAVQDAVEEDVLPAELGFEVADLTDDTSAALVAGKLSRIASNKAFAKFLKQPVKPSPKPSPTPTDTAIEPDADAFFASRMSPQKE